MTVGTRERVRNWATGIGLTACLLLTIGIIAKRTYQIKTSARSTEDRVYLRITSLWGGQQIPPPKTFASVAEAANRAVFDEFLRRNEDIDFVRARTIRLPGQASESTMLMAQAGRVAGDILYVNFRAIDSFVMQKFLVPLDEYVLGYVRRYVTEQNARQSDPTQRIRLPEDLTIDKVKPAWIGLHPMIWDTIYRLDPHAGERHVYAWPYDQLAMALQYRKDLFRLRAPALRRAGLDPERPPRTWEELLLYAYHLTDPDRGIYGFELWESGWKCVDILWQAGARVIRIDEDGVSHAEWNTPQGVLAVRYYRKLMTKQKAGRPDPETGEVKYQNITYNYKGTFPTDPFDEGRCAMRFLYSRENQMFDAGQTDPSLIGLAPLPAGPVQLVEDLSKSGLFEKYGFKERGIRWVRFPNGAQAPLSAVNNMDTDGDGKGDGWRIWANEINAPMYGLNALGTDKRQRDAAWRFLEFYASKQAKRIKTRVYVEAGQAIYVNPLYLREFGYQEYLEQVDPSWVEANQDVFRTGRPEPNGRNCQQIYRHVWPAFQKWSVEDPLKNVRANNVDGTVRFTLHADDPGGGDAEAERILADLTRDVQMTEWRLLGQVDPARQARDRRRATWVVLGLTAVLAVAMVFTVRSMAVMARSGGKARHDIVGRRHGWRVHLMAWAFMAMAVGSVLLWMYYPLVRGAVIAFRGYNVVDGYGAWSLQNFVDVINAEMFWKAFRNTWWYVFLNLSIGFFLPIFLAIMLDEIPVGKLFFRIIYYLPAIMTGLVVAFVWKWMYEPSADGLLNQGLMRLQGHLSVVLGWFGAGPVEWVTSREPVQWLGNRNIAMLSCVVPTIWAGVGPGCIIYLAALKAIPEDIYEAADLDGCGPMRKALSITIPYLWPLVIINFVGAFILAFKTWQNIFVLTGGVPDSTHVLGMEVWYNAFAYLKFGYATAVAWIIGALLIGFTLTQLRILRRMRFTTAQRD